MTNSERSDLATGRSDTARAVESLGRQLPPELISLATLAYNYWWSWAPGGNELFEMIDSLRWQRCGQNPVRLLQEVGPLRLSELAGDSAFVARAHALASRLETYLT